MDASLLEAPQAMRIGGPMSEAAPSKLTASDVPKWKCVSST